MKTRTFCTFEGCSKRTNAAGLCRGHYGQRLRGEPLRSIRDRMSKWGECSKVSCAKPIYCRGLCRKHYRDLRPNQGRGDPESQKSRRMMYLHGITMEQYENMLDAQGGVCASCGKICKTGKRLAVDHDHETGEIRGLLCLKCNMALGLLDDSLCSIVQLGRYLKDFS